MQVENRAAPYDPYIPSNHGSDDERSNNKSNSRTTEVQQQVDDVVNIMQDNIDKVMNRGERLEDLRGKTEDLNATAGNFKRGANQVRRRMWWKDLKWKIIIGVTILVIIGIIIGSIVGTQTHKDNNKQQQQPPAQTNSATQDASQSPSPSTQDTTQSSQESQPQ